MDKTIWNEMCRDEVRRAEYALQEYAEAVEDFEDEAKEFEQYAKQDPRARYQGVTYANRAKFTSRKAEKARTQVEFWKATKAHFEALIKD